MALLTPKWLFFDLEHDDDDGDRVEGDDVDDDAHVDRDDDQGVQHTNVDDLRKYCIPNF